MLEAFASCRVDDAVSEVVLELRSRLFDQCLEVRLERRVEGAIVVFDAVEQL